MSLIKKKFFPRFFRDRRIKPEYLISAETKFDAAHRLSDYSGKCRKIHGHTYRVLIVIKSSKLTKWGAVMDFRDLKKLLKAHIDEKYDHKLILKSDDYINKEIYKVICFENWIVWMNNNPTAENIARDIYKDLSPVFKTTYRGVELASVTVFETAINMATYREKP